MKKCFECKATEDVQEHHVVPASRGKNTWNTSQVRKLFLRYKKLTQEDK